MMPGWGCGGCSRNAATSERARVHNTADASRTPTAAADSQVTASQNANLCHEPGFLPAFLPPLAGAFLTFSTLGGGESALGFRLGGGASSGGLRGMVRRGREGSSSYHLPFCAERLSEVAVLDPRSTYSLWSRMPSGPNAIHSPSGSARRMRRSTP